MKLQKAIQTVTDYPTKKSINPILLSATVAVALTACTAGKMPNNRQESNSSTPISSNVGEEVQPPDNIAGGIPVYIPEQNQTAEPSPQK